MALQIIGSLIVATYSICMPILISWIHQLKKDKKEANAYMKLSVEALTETVNKIDKKIDYNEAMTSRYRIIRASDEIKNGAELSEDHLEQLGEDIEIYKAYCKSNPDYKNHKGQKSMKMVLDYEKRFTKIDEVAQGA